MGAVLAYIGRLYAVEKGARKTGIRGKDLRFAECIDHCSLPTWIMGAHPWVAGW